jgi:putative Holliday junction resolvase
VRHVGVDYGRKRIGLALSDHSATLASPWQTIAAGSTPAQSAERVRDLIDTLRHGLDETEIAGIVVGLPRRLNGEDTDQTAAARRFAERLGALSGLPVHLQDERLTSHEAEARLSLRERDWRRRKQKLDAAAAAIILQDFLDRPARAEAEPQR